jgi:hypothetical protein
MEPFEMAIMNGGVILYLLHLIKQVGPLKCAQLVID